jgi:phytoene dehydrogenase-like protein
MTYDAILIGAGVNGLVTAAYLARAGLKVLVLERREVVGGVAVTEEVFPGFRFDACLDDAGWLAPRIAADLDLSRLGLTVLPGAAGVATPLPDGRHLRLSPDVATSAQSIRALSAADADRWPAFSERIHRFAGFLEALYAVPAPRVPDPAPADLLDLLRLGIRLRGLGRTEMVELLRFLPMSVAECLDDRFESDALKGTVGAGGVTRLFHGPRAGGTAFVLLHHQVGRAPGAFRSSWALRGGVGALAGALAAAARQAGAEIRAGAEVARITVAGDRTTGVVLATGEEIGGRRVVSGVDPRRTLLGLLDPSLLEPEFVRAVRNIRCRGAWAKVNLALGALPAFPALRGADDALRGTISISPSLDYLERAYDDAKYGALSSRPFLEVRIPSLADPGLAPAGKHVMSVQVQYAPYHLKNGRWDAAARDALGRRVEETLEEYAPGLTSAILHRQVLTPKDLEDVYGVTEGNTGHGELALEQVLFMRPVAGWSRYRTPIAGLYLCGAGTHPGRGIAGGSGYHAARAVLKDGGGRAGS